MKIMCAMGLGLFFMMGLGGCDFFVDSEVKQASQQYQQSQDLESLETLHKQLKPGMARSEVEALLGAAQYSPTEGIDYFPTEPAGAQQSSTVGLVVEYIDEKGEATDQVQKFWLGEVGE